MRGGKALVVIAPNRFEETELEGTLTALRQHDYEVHVGSTRAGECVGKRGQKWVADVALKDVKADDYGRVAFIGGTGAADLANDGNAVRVAREFYDKNKVVGAICHGPMVLAASGILQNKHATAWMGDAANAPGKFLTEHGADVRRDEKIVVAGNIVTAQGPSEALEFGVRFANMKAAERE